MTDILDTREAGPAAIRGGALRAAGFGIGVVLSAASAPILARHLGVEDFGRYVLVVSLVTIVGGVTDAGLTNIGIREHALRREPADARRMLGNLLGLRLAVTGAGVLAACGFGVLAGYEDVLVAGTALAGAGLVASVVQATFTVPLSTGLRLGWVTALELAKQVVMVAVLVALVVAGASLLPFFAATLAGGLVALVATAWVAGRGVPRMPALEPAEWRALLRDAIPYAAATALGIVYFRVAIVLMELVSTDTQTGYFGTAFRIVEIAAGLPWVVVLSAFPILARAARDDHERLRHALQRMFEIAVIGGVGSALALLLGAQVAVDVVGGPGYEPAVPVLRIQALALVGSFLVATWGFALLSLRRHGALVACNGLALACAVVLVLALAPGDGARGAAIALVVTECVLALAYAVALMGPRADLRVGLRVVPRVAIAAALAGAVVLLGLPALAQVLLALAIYAGAVLLLRAVPPDVWAALRR